MDKIEDFKNLHDGKRLFILASGPSLSFLDLGPLRRRIVMGLNRSSKIFPGTLYHCTMDLRLFEECPEALKTANYLFTLEDRPWGIPIKLLGSEGFSWDLGRGIYSGYTVSYMALQIAVYMGFNEIFYLGLDLKHDGPRTHFFGHDFHSHAHEQTEFPKMRKMLCYGAQVLANAGVRIFNCNPDSALECFPKVTYEYAVSL
ncbi:MAG: hypothetical protein HZA02_00645 [Nitrospinae bacterium]|nr:hypothetical protein [Nitrospinota bacterium]